LVITFTKKDDFAGGSFVDVFEAIRTTRAMRRLDPHKSVADADILRLVDAAMRGPNGGNTQPVRCVVVTDPDLKLRLGEIYRDCWKHFRSSYVNETGLSEQAEKVVRSGDHLGEHMGESPVIIVVCARDAHPASVYPGIQNLLLAGRALGLGTTLTTVHTHREEDVRRLLGIPGDVKTYALIPVGYPTGRWGEAPRRPVHEVTYWNGWRVMRNSSGQAPA
jgi:nitroreductase